MNHHLKIYKLHSKFGEFSLYIFSPRADHRSIIHRAKYHRRIIFKVRTNLRRISTPRQEELQDHRWWTLRGPRQSHGSRDFRNRRSNGASTEEEEGEREG